ncbi:alpha/beta-hydrolase [Coprinopsis marcescibilis]|uniref:sn-1-specific diacylglycerol lipase n=1 Tax=Coprinopsis marcescibilis TaxID=230819 RepID=A0A5C3KP13_COPMA|nr:alpha/beta-hydrolase [Coprinopsis marcescibilis]
MAYHWDWYSRQSIDIARVATGIGFHVAKVGTRTGVRISQTFGDKSDISFQFSIARGICTTAATATSIAVDYTLFRGTTVTSATLPTAVSAVLSIAEQITLAPIHLGEYITNTSLLAAHSSINVLSCFFPGSSEASFSLASFIDLVRREWNPPNQSNLPKAQYGITQVARAIVGWVALQGATQEWQEKRWFKYLKEVDVKDAPKSSDHHSSRHSRIRVTSDIIFPGQNGHQIITASIGDVPTQAEKIQLRRTRSRQYVRMPSMTSLHEVVQVEDSVPISELKVTLRRFSKMVLAGYGGASLLFFGVSPHAQPAPSTIQQEKSEEEATLASAIDASEAEAAGEFPQLDKSAKETLFHQYSWWDVLLGRHDQEIFESSLANPEEQSTRKRLNDLKDKMKSRAVIGDEHLMPRFWVLTDYRREQIVLVIRGTMSLNEIAADLTCESEPFQPAESPVESDEQHLPGKLAFPTMTSSKSPEEKPKYYVHSGMLRMAKAMGGIGKPVQLAVMEALHAHPDFELVLCGHSLGAGVAALLGMIWADPKTCLTVPSSGLAVGRRVTVYCFAPPALTDLNLSRIARKLVISFVYSHDVVSRLSLGSIRDIRNASMWLCEANDSPDGKRQGEGYAALTARARQWKAGKGSPSDPEWFISMRKTLEASMQDVEMYPPGRVLWGIRDSELHHTHRRFPDHPDKLRLFDVLAVEGVFSQIVFAKNMLTAHMPHQYDKALHELL